MRSPAVILQRGSTGVMWLLALVEWGPMCLFSIGIIAWSESLRPWQLMWSLALVIYAGFKWATWRQALAGGGQPSEFRTLAYLFLYPGMDAVTFLGPRGPVRRAAPIFWFWTIAKIGCGAGLLWGVARLAGPGLLAGWIGMAGMVCLLHFGIFDGVVAFWKRFGLCAQPLMQAPVRSASLGEFWGRRWNSAFRDLAFGLIFQPLSGRIGVTRAMMITFLLSGAVHDLVISFPARGGYGLPTIYFVLQGAAIVAERSLYGRRVRAAYPWLLRGFAMVVVVAPIGLLFHPPFVTTVIVPFMEAIRAL